MKDDRELCMSADAQNLKEMKGDRELCMAALTHGRSWTKEVA